jgi:hypothetical protein
MVYKLLNKDASYFKESVRDAINAAKLQGKRYYSITMNNDLFMRLTREINFYEFIGNVRRIKFMDLKVIRSHDLDQETILLTERDFVES